MLSGRPRALLIDEFCSGLDLLTAAVLCRQLRRLVNTHPLVALIATPRAELLTALRPDRVLLKPLCEPARWLDAGQAFPRRDPLPDPRRWRIVRGCLDDYHQLGRFHYLGGPPAAHKRVYAIRSPRRWRPLGAPEVAAVAVVSPPVPCVRGRNVATFGRYVGCDHKANRARLNREVECISRVVVHPMFRGCGLAVRLVRHVLRHSRYRHVEALAAMGKIHPFFELAGMRPVGLFKGPSQYYRYYLHTNPESTPEQP
jgi:GNAT superfamily N-acetyltransferase